MEDGSCQRLLGNIKRELNTSLLLQEAVFFSLSFFGQTNCISLKHPSIGSIIWTKTFLQTAFHPSQGHVLAQHTTPPTSSFYSFFFFFCPAEGSSDRCWLELLLLLPSDSDQQATESFENAVDRSTTECLFFFFLPPVRSSHSILFSRGSVPVLGPAQSRLVLSVGALWRLPPAPHSLFMNRLALFVYWEPSCHWWLHNRINPWTRIPGP